MTSHSDRTTRTGADSPDPPGSPARALLTRRALLRTGACAAGGLGLSLFGAHAAYAAHGRGADAIGPLRDPDANGLRLPEGFSSRVVARTGHRVGRSGYIWHASPDGGATFAAPDGGWVYVSNSEKGSGGGGVGAIRFAADGSIADAYSILTGTSRNCAGGPTPWATWLSCEEIPYGDVYECDPMSPGSQGKLRRALGRFRHEAAAVDPVRQQIYLTEDEVDGLLYRFTPDAYPSLESGTLEAAQILGTGAIVPGQVRGLAWHTVADPTPASGGFQLWGYTPLADRATRHQVAAATRFNGGEGCWYERDSLFLATKGDNRVWQIDAAQDRISILYDLRTAAVQELRDVDNLVGAGNGDIYVAEDPGDLQIVALTAGGSVKPVVQLTGQWGTELCGPALCPRGDRLYFSSQRHPGTTYEVTGPFASARVSGAAAAGWLST